MTFRFPLCLGYAARAMMSPRLSRCMHASWVASGGCDRHVPDHGVHTNVRAGADLRRQRRRRRRRRARRQLARFRERNPSLQVELRATPDAADQRHQLYVQWLNAQASDPDVLQLDVVWTPEFAAAGWIASLDRFQPPVDRVLCRRRSPPTAGTAAPSRCRGSSTSACCTGAPIWCRSRRATSTICREQGAARAAEAGLPFGFVWQGARYEGLVTVFLEHLGAFGGAILGRSRRGRGRFRGGRAGADVHARRDLCRAARAAGRAHLAGGADAVRVSERPGGVHAQLAVCLRAAAGPPQSSVAGRFAVAAMPAAAGGAPTAALGGVGARHQRVFSDQPDAAYQLIDYLLAARADDRAGARCRPVSDAAGAVRRRGARRRADAFRARDALAIIERAVPRPVTPVYSELSEILQIALHRALTRQQEPRAGAAGGGRRRCGRCWRGSSWRRRHS